MYAHRSSPSFSRVILRLFLLISVILGSYYAYSAFHQVDPLQARLHALGYPEKGFIMTGNIIRWADGHLTVMQGDYVENYPITAAAAYSAAENYLAPYNLKLKAHGYALKVKESSLTEMEKDGQKYFVFEVQLDTGRNSLFAGMVWVNRKTGTVSLKGLLG
ncbi:hypothetical protein [Thermococcus sp. Bubb.Bath]|uniref:hypothetical protein n=1 Tax=Thermococcus sp. Bubb.Bath TaxID=1638242 RepID=UPI001438A287|nr:hypothetical protein [Thermococcus sp. Bubb.Bath]NJF24543.1 hypothetical protein [Thermococcus sp. Bubb.Bath]